MTPQEIFDTALFALRKQKQRSVDEIGFKCLYRGPGGKKCAAGHLISDEDYRSDMEGVTFGEGEMFSHLKELQEHKSLIQALQKAHDCALSKSLDHWEREMQTISQLFDLKYDRLYI